MSLEHWQMERSPFRTTVDPVRLYPSEALSEATARVGYLVDERRRAGVLLGERGYGKTATLASIRLSLEEQGAAAAVIDSYGLSRRELLWQTAEGLRAGPDPTDDEARLWRKLADCVRQFKWQNRASVLLLDDADQLGADLMRQLVRLLRIDPEHDARWTVVLATQPDRLQRLDEAVLHAIDLRIDLEAWTEDDTFGYVQDALIEAGRLTPVFDDDALSLLHNLTSGVPRHVVRLADFALVAGAGAGVELINASLVEQAFEEISWSPPAVAT